MLTTRNCYPFGTMGWYQGNLVEVVEDDGGKYLTVHLLEDGPFGVCPVGKPFIIHWMHFMPRG